LLLQFTVFLAISTQNVHYIQLYLDGEALSIITIEYNVLS
jgi:hypothetical protein